MRDLSLKRTTEVVGNYYNFWGIDVALVEAYLVLPDEQGLDRVCVAVPITHLARTGL